MAPPHFFEKSFTISLATPIYSQIFCNIQALPCTSLVLFKISSIICWNRITFWWYNKHIERYLNHEILLYHLMKPIKLVIESIPWMVLKLMTTCNFKTRTGYNNINVFRNELNRCDSLFSNTIFGNTVANNGIDVLDEKQWIITVKFKSETKYLTWTFSFL